MTETSKDKLCRISVSLPENLLQQFDTMVSEREYESRSQAIADVLHQKLNEHREEIGQEIMAGTINLVFDHSVPNLQKQLADIQHKYIDEVISSLHVNLENAKTMSVILVQGPGQTLKAIANEMISRRGVSTGKLLLSAAILPPVHPLPKHNNPD
ncbi:MAG: nickel-responsive transcriptional regulator NikR [Gammaproteobacteria bacterium]|uniref:nickel-responsive transcriptional regulator NikR n=1 Tax=Pseudomaricurvus alcaniphilus TaxID=1166482 RepID=UPI0014083C71|nr:nickel-responsive transcriptional regulator NikR [Pseudomaricurvus alcaniphilus]MBR9912309.1 nickel-responsive transcriptional regulator NikR [Gammaproteobacteria bacterium]NHN39332.1 nickel-responsive transcriptional regulator NikR [Pseudomaricurvus alcaniphilus]